MNLFELAAKLVLNKSEYEQGLEEAEQTASGFGGKLKGALGTAGKIGGAALAAVGTAAVAAVGSVAAGVSELGEYGDHIDKMSQKMGISAEAYQEWDAIMQHSGTSIDAMGRGMMTLSKAAETNSDAFQQLGISQEEIASMNQEELFARTIEGLQGMEEGSERTVLAQKLLGGAARELGPLLNTSAEDTEKMRQRVHELGGVMSNDAVKGAAAYQDALQDFQTTLDGAKRNLLSNFLPAVTQVMDGLTSVFSGDESGIEQVQAGVENFVSTLSEKLPAFVDAGAKILTSIITGLVENLPQLLEAGWEIIKILGENLLSLAGQLLEIGWQWILSLTQGIRDKISEVWTAANETWEQARQALFEGVAGALQMGWDWIVNLVQGIADKIGEVVSTANSLWTQAKAELASAVSEMYNTAVEWVTNIISGIGDKIGEVVSKATELWTQAKNEIRNAWSEFKAAGSHLVQGLIAGIGEWIANAVEKARELIRRVKGAANREAEVASPSRWFRRLGRFLDRGLTLGIDDEADQPVNAMVGVVREVSSAMDELAVHTEGVAGKIVSAVETTSQALQYVANQDYAALMMQAQSLEEFEKYAELRAAKIAGEGMDLAALGYATNDELLSQWKSSHSSMVSSALSGASSHSDYSSSGVSRGGITIVVNAAQGQSEDSIAAKVERKLMQALGQREAVWV